MRYLKLFTKYMIEKAKCETWRLNAFDLRERMEALENRVRSFDRELDDISGQIVSLALETVALKEDVKALIGAQAERDMAVTDTPEFDSLLDGKED